MGTGKRYNFRNHPGPTKTLSFRVNESANALLDDRVAKLKAAGEIEDRTEALQDALVKWLMLEELAEQQSAEPITTEESDAPVGNAGH